MTTLVFAYELISWFVFVALGLMWTKSNYLNFSIKVAFFALTLLDTYIILHP